MTARALVIGLGQPAAGDDGVGIAVVVRLRVEGDLEGVCYETVAEPSALVEGLKSGVPIILVDAVIGAGRPGDVVVLDVDDLTGDLRPLSTHGISVSQAIALARALAPEFVSPMIRVIGIVIERPSVGATALSAPVAAAVPLACAKVHEALRQLMS